MFAIKACEVKKSGVYFCVNEYFFDKRNEDSGHYGQTLIISKTLSVDKKHYQSVDLILFVYFVLQADQVVE